MLSDPKDLPDKKSLKLSEVVHFLAFGETRDVHGLREAGTPAIRALEPNIEETLRRCLAEASTNPQHSEFVELVNKDGFWNFDPVSPWLHRCKHAWPPSGERFYDLVVELDQAQEQDNKKRKEASALVEKWLASGRVVFKGYRDGRLETIEVNNLDDMSVFWEDEFISAFPRDVANAMPQHGTSRPMHVWEAVRIERASLMAWLRPTPDPKQFDPMQRADWTLPMVVAWIRSRSVCGAAIKVRA